MDKKEKKILEQACGKNEQQITGKKKISIPDIRRQQSYPSKR